MSFIFKVCSKTPLFPKYLAKYLCLGLNFNKISSSSIFCNLIFKKKFVELDFEDIKFT